MPRISELVRSLVPSKLCAGGSSSQTPASSRSAGNKPPADLELEGWRKRGYPSEYRATAVKTIEASEKYQRSRVNLSRLALEDLPSAVSRLAATEKLNLSGNQLESWPAELTGLTNLKELNVSSNKINNISAGIGALSQLKSLNAQSNWINFHAIDPAIAGLRGLRELNLSTNRLTAFPTVILELPALEKLSLADNQIKTLPAIDRLHHLTDLDLSMNPLGAIPDGPDHPEGSNGADDTRLPAAKLPAGLRKLILAQTMLEDIETSAALPEHVGKLQALEFLDVSSNPRLKRLPIAFRTFRTDGPDKVKSTGRKPKLTVLHEGSGVAEGLERDGRLLGSAHLDEAGSSNGAGSGTDASDWDTRARIYIRRKAQADLDAPPGNGPLPGPGGNPQNPMGMGANAALMHGYRPTMPAQGFGAGQGSFPLPANPQAGAGGMFGSQATPVAATGPIGQAGQIGQLPTMPLPQASFGLQAGAMDPRTMLLMQLGMQTLEQQLAQLRAAFGYAPQPAGQVPNPLGAGLFQPAYAAAGLQQTAPAAQNPPPPAWAVPPSTGAQVPQTTPASQHQEEIASRNNAILRDQQMRGVCMTIPQTLPDEGVAALAAAIKADILQRGLTEQASRYMTEISMIDLGRKLYRQHMVDTYAKRDALNRADPHITARYLSIAYQTMLAGPNELDLVGPIRKLEEHLSQGTIRGDLFDGLLPTQTLVNECDKVLAEVRATEKADVNDMGFNAFLWKQKFWQEHNNLAGQHITNTVYTHL